jgi:hypothetical protein
MGDYVHRMARIVDRNPQNAVAAEEFARAVDALHGTAQIVADAGSQAGRNAGRNLEAMKIVVGAKRGLLPQIRGSIEGMSRADVLAQARRVVLTEGDPAKIIGEVRAGRELQMGKGERFLRRVVSYRIQNLLSGPRTHVVNSVSNAITSALRPAEMIYAGTISRNPALRQQGWDILAGNFMYLKDAWTSMRKAFRAGDSLLDPHHTTDDRTIRMGITGSKRVDPLLEIPSRFLISEDEFFKNYQYRSFIRSRSLRHSRELGLVDPREMAKRVDDDIRNTFDLDTGRGLDEEGIQWARVSTFTNDLGVGTFAQGIQSFVNKHPMAKILIPFFRTPANLARFVGQRTPLLARWGRQWKMDVAAGGERAAMARAREQVGLMFWSTAAFLAASGRMTGRGPRNKNLRETWLQTHRPYSVRIGDQWVSLRRGDPVLTPFTLVADAFEIWPELGGQDQLRMVATVSAAVAANITDKTYLSSLTQAVEGFTSDEPARMSRVMKELVFSSAIPFSAGLRQFANTDQYYRETANLIDELARRVPGWSETLEPSRNLFGEPIMRAPGADPAATDPPGGAAGEVLSALERSINPFEVRAVVNDEAADELLLLRRGIGMPARYIMAGKERVIDLRDRGRYGDQSPYDRMMEIQTTKRIGGRSLREALTDLVRSEGYQNLTPGTAAQPGGARYMVASRVVQAYQDAALAIVKQENEQLRQDFRYLYSLRNAAKFEGETGVERVQALFGVRP